MAQHTKKPTTGGYIRIALYAVTVIVALIATVAPALGFGNIEGVAQALAGVLAILSGGTAILKVPDADDQQLNLRELIPAVGNVVTEVRDLRERQPQEVADEVEKRVTPTPAPAPQPEPQEPATGNSLLADMQERIAQQRG